MRMAVKVPPAPNAPWTSTTRPVTSAASPQPAGRVAMRVNLDPLAGERADREAVGEHRRVVGLHPHAAHDEGRRPDRGVDRGDRAVQLGRDRHALGGAARTVGADAPAQRHLHAGGERGRAAAPVVVDLRGGVVVAHAVQDHAAADHRARRERDRRAGAVGATAGERRTGADTGAGARAVAAAAAAGDRSREERGEERDDGAAREGGRVLMGASLPAGRCRRSLRT
jgi:hypothetical protein